jgi:3-dehydroquinate synthase
VDRFLIGGISEVMVGRGLLAGGLLPEQEGRRSAAVVAQPGSASIAERIAVDLVRTGLRAPMRVLPDGDAAKTLAVAEDVYGWLSAERIGRGDSLVAVGGGALTDVAGFVAATYLRGIEAVYVPTTLLGAVDASIGGKTGLNLEGKNLVGAFRHPARVIIDVAVLEALPEHLLREGCAEALKTGLIGDGALLDLLASTGLDADLGEVVRRSVAVKAAVVNRDPTEQGERAHLNYGHTVGHAVETATGCSHGHAVAVGMVAAGRASALVLGFPDEERQTTALERLGLPVTAVGRDGAAPEAGVVLGLMEKDKKRDHTGLRMVLLEAVGSPRVVHADAATVGAALEAVGIA